MRLQGRVPHPVPAAGSRRPADRPTILAAEIPRSWLKQYEDYYASRSVLLINGSRLLGQGRVRTGEMMCTPALFLASEFYNDFLKHMDARYSLGGTIATDGKNCCNISLFRGHAARPFEEEDLALLGILMPHLRRAMELHDRLADLDERRHCHSELLDRLALGVICLGPCGEVRHANRAARGVLQERNGLSVERGVLRAAAPSATAALHTVVASVANTALGQGTSAGDTLCLPRCGRRPLEAQVLPARACPASSSGCGTVAFLFVSDPEQSAVPVEARARRFYNLTAAEARVVAGLMAGETDRQAELLRLLGRWSSLEVGEDERARDPHPAGPLRRTSR